MADRVKTNGVNVAAVARLLGTASGEDISRSEKVNIYSMVKPLDVDVRRTLTENDFQQENWGYTIPPAKQPADLVNYVVNGVLPSGWLSFAKEGITHRFMVGHWAYRIPTGRVRLLDFDGYDHSAESLFYMSVRTAGGTVIENLYSDAASVVFDFSSSQNCELEEFVDLRRGAATPMYYGVLCFDGDGIGYEYFNTASKTLTVNNSEFAKFFRTPSIDGKQVYLMPCVCDTLCNKDGWTVAGRPSLIPLCAPTLSITYYTAMPMFVISSKYAYRSSGKAITWAVNVKNNGTGMGDVLIKVEDVGSGLIYTNQSKSIAAGASASWSGVQSYAGSVASVQQLKVSMTAQGKTTVSYIQVTDKIAPQL